MSRRLPSGMILAQSLTHGWPGKYALAVQVSSENLTEVAAIISVESSRRNAPLELRITAHPDRALALTVVDNEYDDVNLHAGDVIVLRAGEQQAEAMRESSFLTDYKVID